MKAEYGFIDPGAIMGVVVALIILAVGVFAFFVVTAEFKTANPAFTYDPGGSGLPDYENWSSITHTAWNASGNTSGIGSSVFNIIGIVLIIGAIMSIVGLVYNYIR